ncbi:MAG: F0F1 ATP synthase subunit B [Yoonia sp.]|nr:F0F1 ATP synthase subunit B [Yoonia sp.]
MSIDWITVAAQIANFLVLVWLLKRFLYRPILDGIDAREAEITNRMTEAVQAKDDANTVKEAYHDKARALHVAQSEMSETIRKSAEEKRDALLVEARQRMEREQASWQTHLDDEARKYATQMHRAGAGALLSLTRKALMDLADETLEDRMAHHLVHQLRPIADDLKKAAGDGPAAVVSSHDRLPVSAQDSLAAELKGLFPDVTADFKTDPTQAPGLILRIGGAELAWTVESYIDGLEALIGDRLGNSTGKKAQANGD